jgi:cellulose synthase/poly-beta-1,6-N-acetylglucosamine synthase-like glycosyltransferase
LHHEPVVSSLSGRASIPHAAVECTTADAFRPTTGSLTLPGRFDQAFADASPRYTPPPTPLASLLIHGGVLVLWVLLFARALGGHGLAAWSTGIAYVAYDTALLAFVAWQTLPLLRSTTLSGPAMDRPSLGVIVAAHNEAGILPKTLAALFAQTDRPDAILIADDGSHDSTPDLLASFGLQAPAIGALSAPSTTHPGLRWLRLPHQGKARALNDAMPRIDTDIVLTVDADTLLQEGAIAAMRQAFAADPHLVAATGVLVPDCGPSLSGRVFAWFQTYEYIRNFLSRYAWSRLDSLLLISGAFAGFRRTALFHVGGFDPDCLVEDYELIHRLLRYSALRGLGWHSAVLGRAGATTDAPGSAGAFLRQRRRWFGGFLQTQFWYRDMVGNRRYGWLGLAMLPVKAADTLQPIYGLTAFGLLIWFLATGQFAIVLPVAGIMLGKIVIDLSFHVWSVILYRRWTGDSRHNSLGHAFAAAVAEPFSFQLFRHLGAAMGWWVFLTGRRNWGTKSRFGAIAPSGAE